MEKVHSVNNHKDFILDNIDDDLTHNINLLDGSNHSEFISFGFRSWIYK